MDIPRSQPQIEPGAGERIARGAVFAFLALAIVTLAFALGYGASELFGDDGTRTVVQADSSGGDGTTSFSDDVLDEIYQIIQDDFVDRDVIDPEQLRQAAINGVIASLNDPHTTYLTPQDLASGALDLGASYDGIGASVDDTNGAIQIIAPFRDSPAEAAGIEPGDIILAVDGEPTDGWSAQQAVQRIRGIAGTPVVLTVQHSSGVVEDVTIVRGSIPILSVFTELLLPPFAGSGGLELVDSEGAPVEDIGYIHISQFHRETPAELRAALEQINAIPNLRGLILDVRLNPGGLLSTTVQATDEFLDGGRILTERDGDGREQNWEASGGGLFTELPIVIIQDGSSASGAEVLAAALRDNGRAVIVGTTSFGKGTVNQLKELESCGAEECGALYLSIGRWYTPTGQGIEGVGVEPDIEVELTAESYDAEGDLQLFAAIDYLRSQ